MYTMRSTNLNKPIAMSLTYIKSIPLSHAAVLMSHAGRTHHVQVVASGQLTVGVVGEPHGNHQLSAHLHAVDDRGDHARIHP